MIGIDRSYVDINILKYFEMCNMQIYLKGFCTDKPMFASLSLSKNSYPYIILRHMTYVLILCTYLNNQLKIFSGFFIQLPGRWPGSCRMTCRGEKKGAPFSTAKPCAQMHCTKLINKKLQKSIPTHAWRFLSGTLEVRGLVPSRKWGKVRAWFSSTIGGPHILI